MTPRATLLFLGNPDHDRRIQSLRDWLLHEGWQVQLLCGVSQKESVTTAATLLRIAAGHGPRRFLEYHRLLTRALEGHETELVVAGDLYSLTAAASARRSGMARRLIYDAREVYTELPSVARRPAAKRFWYQREHRGLRHADLIAITGEIDLQDICAIHSYAPRPLLLRNLPMFSDVPRNRAVLKEFAIPDNAPVLVYVGGLQQGRGLHASIAAMLGVDGHLLIVGDGQLRSALEQHVADLRLADRVHFSGARSAQEALSLAAACDVGLSLIEPLSRSYELALPSKMFEYTMLGLPIVASPLEQVTQLFGSSEWVVFADPSNSVAVSEALKKALVLSQNSQVKETARDAGRTRFHFTVDANRLRPILRQWFETEMVR